MDTEDSLLMDMLLDGAASVGQMLFDVSDDVPQPDDPSMPQPPDVLLILLPLLIVLSTFLFLLLLFLICVLLLRRRRGIALGDHEGPVDMSREDLVHGDGGFEGVESRWMEGVTDIVRRQYLRGKEYQLQYPPNSLPTDITLSQFLSIQEKGVSAWSFEPDYELVNSLLVHARTEITFLPDPESASCVQSNLPLPKLNEVYYWEVKMFDLPETTTVAVGLATKPYPPFRLPGLNRNSVAYHSNGDKSHNYPFTAQPFGPRLKEGDVLGVGYRPRSGTVFFTRNGRKMEDAFTGMSRWNLFPTIGADGPCSVHVNLGQAGFVFIEANVKKWGLAPSVGTLAPPPAYGSERGSILLDVGGRSRSNTPAGTPGTSTPTPHHPRRSHRSRRPKNNITSPIASSPLRTSSLAPSPLTPPPPITPIDEEPEDQAGPSTGRRYISPTDLPFHTPHNTNLPSSPEEYSSLLEGDEGEESVSSSSTSTSRPTSPLLIASTSAASSSVAPSTESTAGARNPFSVPRHQRKDSLTHFAASLSSPGPSTSVDDGSQVELSIEVHPPVPESPVPYSENPPTPHPRDIHLQALSRNGPTDTSYVGEDVLPTSPGGGILPPAYSPLDAFTYADGVHIDLPAEFIQAALEGNQVPEASLGTGNTSVNVRRQRRGSRR